MGKEEIAIQNPNLAGLVVLYHPVIEVIDNVVSYLPYISHLYLIDNSENPDQEIIHSLLSLGTKISYISMNGNMGISRALNKGSGLAIEAGYTWILTMDQDSFFGSGSFFQFLTRDKYQNIAILAASFELSFFNKRNSDYPDFYEVGYVITSGNLLNLKVWKTVGGFLDELFIDEVDNEFCIRARNSGYRILSSKEVFLIHKLGRKVPVNRLFGFGKSNYSIHSEIRLYYMFRNNIYLFKKYVFSNFRFVMHKVGKLLIMFFKVLVFFPNKKSCLGYIFKGFRDGFLNKLGKYS